MKERYIRIGAVVVMLLALVASLIYTGGGLSISSADDSAFNKNCVSYNKDAQCLTISKGIANVNEIYFGVATVKNVKVSGQSVKVGGVSQWNIYDYNASADAMNIDLSTLSGGNDLYVILKALKKDGMFSEAFAIKFEKNVNKLQASVTYTGDKPSIKITDKATKAVVANGSLEYRLTTTGWTALDKIDLVGLTHRGASVMVRSAPVANNISTAAASTAAADQFYEYSNATKYIPVYVAGKLAGKEHKVVIKGEGSVPSATFNYTTGKISMPNATECRFVTGEPGKPGTVSAWTDAYAGRDTVIKGASGIPQMGYIEVRKKATSKGPNSRSRVLPYKVVDAPVAFDASGNAMATDVTAMNAYVVASKTADKSTGVTITYATRNNSGSEYKVTFTNGGSDLYEFRIVPQGKTLESIKAGSKIGKSAVGDHVKPGSAIYIRRAADKETGTITSDFVYAGVVK